MESEKQMTATAVREMDKWWIDGKASDDYENHFTELETEFGGGGEEAREILNVVNERQYCSQSKKGINDDGKKYSSVYERTQKDMGYLYRFKWFFFFLSYGTIYSIQVVFYLIGLLKIDTYYLI